MNETIVNYADESTGENTTWELKHSNPVQHNTEALMINN